MVRILSQSGAILHGEKDACNTAGLFDHPRALAGRIAAIVFAALAFGCGGVTAQAQPEGGVPWLTAPPLLTPAEAASAAALAASDVSVRTRDFRAPTGPAWITVPRINDRLTAKDIGLVVNDADPYSVEVGAFYAKARKLAPQQVLHVNLPVKGSLSADEFRQLSGRIDEFFGTRVQALALAWVQPFAAGCNSITGALAMGLDESICARSCAPTRRSPYFDAPTPRPLADLHMRLSMLLAAPDVAAAKALIRRGVAADRSLGLRGAPTANVYFVNTPDGARSVRRVLFPPAGPIARAGIDVHVENAQSLENIDRVLVYETGLVRVGKLDTIRWLPGALADHLTSTGGNLTSNSQMSVLEWIGSGATASYGTVSEPCNHLQKFPHPQVLLLNYVQGSTAIEAYWRSVAWPLQGLFIGEPLAAPFARR
jgi:uncharacterized protein (TIGR03790 family)